MLWKTEAERLYAEYGRQWSVIADKLMPQFPGLKHFEVKEKVRRYIRDTPGFKETAKEVVQTTESPFASRRYVQKAGKPCMVEVNIADLHLGKLCWHGDTGNNYDYKIASVVFRQLVNDACGRIRDKNIDYITFVGFNDFFNSDNPEKTTTAGTPQDTDIRWQKLFNVGLDLLKYGITQLAEIAPVKALYTPSNHDEQTSYHTAVALQCYFRNDRDVEIDIDAYPRKYQLYGNILLGYCHGDKEGKESKTPIKASRLAALMPLEAREMWGKAKFAEMHTAHLHSEQTTEEANGVKVRRVSSPTFTDTWHCTSGFIGAVKQAQVFVYDKEYGLSDIMMLPVRD